MQADSDSIKVMGVEVGWYSNANGKREFVYLLLCLASFWGGEKAVNITQLASMQAY